MNRMPLPSREQGAALLLFMLLLVVGVAVLFLPETPRRSRENEERVTAEALGKARAARFPALPGPRQRRLLRPAL